VSNCSAMEVAIVRTLLVATFIPFLAACSGAGRSGGPDPGGGGTGDGGAIGPHWKPGPGTRWQIQLSGALDTAVDAAVYDVDLFDQPAATVAALQAQGRRVICYFSAGSYEDWRPDEGAFPMAVIGNPLQGWPGERWLDVRARTVRDIMGARMDLAVRKGCDGVDPDNVDGYANATGFPLTAADQLDYDRFLAGAAHARGLAIGLKNDLGQVADLAAAFEWALVEECFQYGECGLLQPFTAAGKPVFEIEYGTQALATTVCPEANVLGFETLVKDLALDAWRISCR
jgi:hypothetical protein